MRILYLILYLTLNYSFRFYFRKIRTVNSPKEFYGRTIYVSNHPSSFMDPLVIAGRRRPIVFFMTRSDVFKPLLKPILWASHMLPIYREQDGEATKERNEEVFAKCISILKGGRNLLIFGEGFTDDIFIRRLKPVKKGAARIGFITLEKWNWEEKLYIAAVGNNFSDPNYIGGDLLIATSDKILLNDYKDLYKESPAKAILAVTKEVEKRMREQITHVENKDLAPLHERITRLTRRGLHPIDHDSEMPLKERWKHSRELALWMNDAENIEAVNELAEPVNTYFTDLKKHDIPEKHVYEASINRLNFLKELFFVIAMIPPALLGIFHCLIPYLAVKKFVEKSFKRKVFWGSVKMVLGTAVIGLFNLPVIWLFYKYVYDNYWLATAYYFFIPFLGYTAYMYFRNLKTLRVKIRLLRMDLKPFIEKREGLVHLIQEKVKI